TLDAVAHFERGLRAYEQLDYATARRDFQQATEADPQSALAFAWAAHSAQILRDNIAARQLAAKASQLTTGGSADALFIDAVGREADGDYQGAARSYENLANIEPDQSTWLLELGAFHYRRASWTDAVATYRNSLIRDAEITRPHLELCGVYNRLHEEAKAKQEGETALAQYRQKGERGGEA